jgi:hypothetical protein
MKTIIEIADDLFERVWRLARKEKTTFRALTEQGLWLVLDEKQKSRKELPLLVTVRGRGLTDEFKNAPWKKSHPRSTVGAAHECFRGTLAP